MAAFPARPDNRPSLPRIGYRIGSYSAIREDLMHRLNATPELAHWTHREPDDPGIALLEVGAVLGDILTFYQELYANEAYVRTAQWRSSVAELVRLVGYRLAPGLGGTGTFAFELRPGAPVIVPAGFSLQVELEGATSQAVFETQTELVAHPDLSRFNLFRPLVDPKVRKGASELWLRSGDAATVEAGDRLLVGVPASGAADRLTTTQILVVDGVSTLHGATIVQIQGALQSDLPAGAVAYRIGRSFRHFGHSSPPDEVSISGDKAVATAVDYCRSLTSTTSIGSGSLRATDLPLDSAIDDFAAGRQVIVSYVGGCSVNNFVFEWGGLSYEMSSNQASGVVGTGYLAESFITSEKLFLQFGPPVVDTVVRTVTRVDASSLRFGSLSGPSTMLGLDRSLDPATKTGADVRTFSIHEVTSARMEVHAKPRDHDASSGRDLYFEGAAETAALLAGRRIVFLPPGGEALATVAAAVAVGDAGVSGLDGLHKVTLATDVDYAGFPQEGGDAATVVLGNVVDADEGQTEPQVAIGSGDARSIFQTFKLPKAPLTYHQAPSQTPPLAPGLEVAVAGRTWTRVESLFGRGSEAEVYIVREDADGNSWVQFGDGGGFGARLPSGVDNVVAKARTGSGSYGPLKENTTVLPARLDRLQAVQLPGVVSGGAEPETADVARAAAPGRVLGLGRLVGLSDFETEALAMPGVALATAAWGLVDGVPTVTVIVLMQSGREQEHAAVAAALRTAARERGADRFEIDVHQGRYRDVRLRADVAVVAGYDPDAVLAAVRAALDDLFSVKSRRFGEDEHLARVAGVIQQASGVAWARVAGSDKALQCPAERVLRLAGAQLTAVTGAMS